jgi:predicted aspartyl protease
MHRRLAGGFWSRRAALTAAMAIACPLCAAAQQPAEPTQGPPEDERTGRQDPTERLTTEVFVEGKGPFHFIIDTGASRSVVSDRLAAALSLRFAEPTLVHGLAGAEPAPAVHIGRMTAGSLSIPVRTLPVLKASDLDCDGLLGLDAFQSRRVVFDFTYRLVSITRSASSELCPRRPLSEAVVRARQRYGQLTIVDASVSGRRVTCFIDSGAQLSVGNRALLEVIKAKGARHGLQTASAVIHGATGDNVTCEVAPVQELRVGDISFSNFLMAFADLHTFDLWSLREEPAIMIGMDFLNLFGRVEIDFRENLVRFRRAPSA